MFAVRYAALLSLVIWLGGMIGLQFFVVPADADVVHFRGVELVCGGLLLVCLFAIKFIGPPPHGFIPRAAIVVLMLLVTVAARYQFDRLSAVSQSLTTVNIGLGLVLLYWYVKE